MSNSIYPTSSYIAAEKAYNSAAQSIDKAGALNTNVNSQFADIVESSTFNNQYDAQYSVLDGEKLFVGNTKNDGYFNDPYNNEIYSKYDYYQQSTEHQNGRGPLAANSTSESNGKIHNNYQNKYTDSQSSHNIHDTQYGSYNHNNTKQQYKTSIESFSSILTKTLKNSINDVNQLNKIAESSIHDEVSMLEVSNAVSRADLALQQMVEVKNSLLSAWDKILSSGL